MISIMKTKSIRSLNTFQYKWSNYTGWNAMSNGSWIELYTAKIIINSSQLMRQLSKCRMTYKLEIISWCFYKFSLLYFFFFYILKPLKRVLRNCIRMYEDLLKWFGITYYYSFTACVYCYIYYSGYGSEASESTQSKFFALITILGLIFYT